MDPLFPYQQTGAAFLAARPRALLADDMGLGKSAQVIAACDLALAVNIVVVCPASGRINWQREFDRFSGFGRPSTALMKKGQAPLQSGVNVVSWDLLASVEARLPDPDALILDEAHYAKERKAARSKAAWRLSKRSKALWCLTGTPAPNNISELWPMLYAFGAFTSDYWSFVRRFCVFHETPFGAKITGAKRIPELKALLSKYMIRRKKEEVMADLPPIRFTDVVVEAEPFDEELVFPEYFMTSQGKSRSDLYEMRDRQESAVKAMWTTAKTSEDRLRAVEGLARHVTTLRRYTGMLKVGQVSRIINEELATGAYDKIVIFAVHRDPIEMMRQSLRKWKPVTLYGGTDPAKRQKNIDRFQKDPACRVFIGQIVAAGTLITLTAAAQVAFLEASWVPAENAQAAMRCHRIGQERPVLVRFFGLAGSVDEDVQRALRLKTKVLAQVFDK